MDGFKMEGMTYLAIAYLGMILGLGVWTWTVVTRSRNLQSRIKALEDSLGLDDFESDIITSEVNDTDKK
ncbi:MAG: hypothetical protein CBC92_000915 [Euryarchaeota archaeon TMED132]|nr:MAG: hypothetical protein CBC92_000915 [Euryarchaeota archaeon TMED132]|tara:strand:+ start:8597 stop:8803 length:207 start_codon:yes stop_codon:yes gene_type:complete